MQTYYWICLIFFIAGVTHGISGFGSVLLSIPLLAMVLNIKTVIVLSNLAALSMTTMIFMQLRHQFDRKKIYPLIAGAVPGIVVGVFFLKRLDQDVIHWILGVILIVFSLYSLIFRASRKEIRKEWAYPFGFFSGCLGGAFSASGPPVIVYITLQNWSKNQIKVTLQSFFFLSGLFVAFSHTLAGLVTFNIIRFYFVGLPAIISGTYIGSFLYGFIREENYRKLILVFLFLLGGLMIYKA
jgi:uncharacterized membrane protein YfcA